MSILDHIKKSPHRNRLERLLKVQLPKLEGTVLDIGSRNRRYDYLLKQVPTAIDLVENKDKGVRQGDVTAIPFPDQTFDAVMCIEVLEYVATPEKAIAEIYRVLKPGGMLVLSVPFMFKAHEDKLRYTDLHLRDLMVGFALKEFYAVGGSYTVVMTILWGKIKSIRSSIFRYILTLLLLPFLLLISKQTKNGRYASGYFLVAQKKHA